MLGLITVTMVIVKLCPACAKHGVVAMVLLVCAGRYRLDDIVLLFWPFAYG